MRSWLARLSFSFIIVGLVLVYQVYRSAKGMAPPLAEWRLWLYLIAATLSFVMAALGVRERHRRPDDGDRE